MQQKIILGMVGGFVVFTVLLIVVIYALSADVSLASFLSPKTRIYPQQEKRQIVLDPKPQQLTKEISTESSTITSTTTTSQEKVENTVDHLSLYSLINAHRKEQGLSSLRAHPALELSSRKKLEDMRNNKYWQHENRDGVVDWSVFDQSGYHYSNAGENLSFGNNSAWAVFNSWVNSPTHNQQMLTAEYEDMGLAIDCQNYQDGAELKCAVVLHLGRQM